MRGAHGTEQLSKAGAQTRLSEAGVDPKDTRAMVAVVEEARWDALPPDALTLRAWTARADEVLPPKVRAARAGEP